MAADDVGEACEGGGDMNALIYADTRPRWVKAYSRAYRVSLLAFIPIGSLSPYGMRVLDASGVRAPAADLILVGVMALPFVGIFLWSFLGEKFWDRVIARFAFVRFALEWAFAFFFLEAGIMMLAATNIGMLIHILSGW